MPKRIESRRYICSRTWTAGKIFYVRELPGEDGVDWGYVDEPGKARPMTTYWKRRFVADMRRVGAVGVNCREVFDEEAGRPANRKQWYTVGYVDRMASLVEDQFQNNPTHYHGHLAALLKQTLETLRGEYVRGAVCAVIWPGQLSRNTAVYGAHALPIHHVFPDGRITGSTG